MWIKRLLAGIAAVLLGAASLALGEWGFSKVLDFRTLERIPPTLVAGSVGGETQLRGVAEPYQTLLAAPKTGRETLYYRYTLEREETDSDGDKSWRTLRDEEQATDFHLRDDSGRALIRAQADLERIDWSVGRSFRTVEGDLRHTEWRIDPGANLTVFGWLEPAAVPTLDFHTKGRYVPIVSTRSASEERGSLGTFAILLLSASITCLVFASLALVYVFSIHRTLVFLLIVTTASTLLLSNYGYRSLEADVMDGAARLAEHRERAGRLINAALAPLGMTHRWASALDPNALEALPTDTRNRINAWRESAWVLRARYLQQIDRFPERAYAVMQGVASPGEITLSPASLTRAQREFDAFEQTRTGHALLFSAIGLVLVCITAWLGFRAIRTKRMQENLTVSKTAGVVYGLTELAGTLVPEQASETLRGPVSGGECVWYRHVVEELRGTGKNRRWVTISDTTRKQPFYCEDDEGRLRIFPGHAEIITHHRTTERQGRHRETETRLEPGDTLYILGKAQVDKTTGETLVIRHSKDSDYIIANESEAAVMFRKALRGMFGLAIGICVLFFCALWIGGGQGHFSSLDFLLASLVAPAFLAVILLTLMYNDLVFLKQRVERNWANIQVSLKKRATLIPQLESVVRRFLEHEVDLQESLADMRTLRGSADTPGEVDRYMALEQSALDRINARMEAYPELRGDKLAAELNRRMIKLENEVALMRAGFNDAVMQYRIRIQRFPDNVIAKLFRFSDRKALAFRPEIRRVPTVEL